MYASRPSVAYLWGIETQNNYPETARIWSSVAYLWGIETLELELDYIRPYQSVAYLWGIETRTVLDKVAEKLSSVAYLWGIETRQKGYTDRIANLVCSLPMRDWNEVMSCWDGRRFCVCSLPMRDWNRITIYRWVERDKSVAYLWGIETMSKGGSREILIQSVAYLWGIETYTAGLCDDFDTLVCSLPMRDWNVKRDKGHAEIAFKSVAYLWGIETRHQSQHNQNP